MSHRHGILPRWLRMAIEGWLRLRRHITQCSGSAMRAPPGSRSRRCDAALHRLAPRPRRCLLHARRGAFVPVRAARRRVDGGDAAADLASLRGPLVRGSRRSCASDRDHLRSLGPFTSTRSDRARAAPTRAGGDVRGRRDSGRHARAPRVAARVVEAKAAVCRGRHSCASPETSHFLRLHARNLPAPRSTRAAWCCGHEDRARVVEPGQRRDCERDGNTAVPDVSRARPSRAGAAVRDLRSQRPVRRPRRRRAARMEGRRRVPVDAGAPRRVPER